MDAFTLKIIAIITMVIDHAGYLIFDDSSFFNYIGRLAFPIFAFQISQGYIHTQNLKKYIARLGAFALISQIPFMLFIYMIIGEFIWLLNIFFTLFLGLLAILAYDKSSNKLLGLFLSIGLAFFANFINADYGFFGVAIITLFYIFRNNNFFMVTSFSLAVIAYYSERIYSAYSRGGNFMSHLILCICTMLPIILILLYNGKKGKNLKRLLYWFYPIHLLIIFGLSLILV